MTDAPTPENSDAIPDGDFHITDNRKIDPTTGEAKSAHAMTDEEVSARIQGLDFTPKDAPPAGAAPGSAASGVDNGALAAAKAEAASHLADLQRERASFTNYRNRALRDQENARVSGRQEVLNALLPALDQIERAKAHGDLTGPMENIATQIDGALGKFGVVRYGEVGEPFDPNVHEALMHREGGEADHDVIDAVIEPGYKIGDKVVRPARVGVVGP